MPTCPHCGATVPEGAVYCGNCGATLNSPTTSTSSSTQSQTSTAWSKDASGGDMQMRLEKALKRTEMLSYGAAGVGVALLVVILVLYLL